MPCSRSPATPLDTLPVLLLVPERLVTELKRASRRSFRCPAVYYLYVGSSPYGPTASPAEVMRHKLAYSSPTLNSRFPRPLPGHCPPQYERLVLDCTVPDRKARCTQERFVFMDQDFLAPRAGHAPGGASRRARARCTSWAET